MPAVATRSDVVENLLHGVRGPLTLRLFGNDFTPHRSQAPSDFVEASFPGYAPVPLDPALWADSGDDPVVLRYPKQTFKLTDDLLVKADVYGWYFTRGGDVVLADRRGLVRLEIAGSRVEVSLTVKE